MHTKSSPTTGKPAAVTDGNGLYSHISWVCLIATFAFSQTRRSLSWTDGGWTLESQVYLWLCFPSRHRWEDDPDWPHVSAGPDEHDDHWMHDVVLQVRPWRFHFQIGTIDWTPCSTFAETIISTGIFPQKTFHSRKNKRAASVSRSRTLCHTWTETLEFNEK